MINQPIASHPTTRGFSLLEVMTALVVISILFLMAIPTFEHLRAKADRAKCTNNLRNLYAAAASYLNDQAGVWPQIPVDDLEDPSYARAWIDAFKPYQIGRINWICPSIQRVLGDPDYSDRGNVRIDYTPTPFDDLPNAAFRWPGQPWFLERGDVHGDGNLIIFTNGQIKSLTEAKKDAVALPSQ